RRIDPAQIQAFLQTQAGQDALRRELVEGAQVRAGQQALIVWDADPSEVAGLEVRATEDMLRQLGLQVSVLRTGEILPRPLAGSVPTSFAYVDKHRIPRIVYG